VEHLEIFLSGDEPDIAENTEYPMRHIREFQPTNAHARLFNAGIKDIEEFFDAEIARRPLSEDVGNHEIFSSRLDHKICGMISSQKCRIDKPDDAPTGRLLAFATAKSSGDFVIAHSVLHRVDAVAKSRLRLIANSHVRELNAILPDDVCVTLVDSDAERVPALFDIKKRGALAALKSALSLRKEFQNLSRRHGEALMFAGFGVRERFIAGDWPVFTPHQPGRNIYENYFEVLAEHQITLTLPPVPIARTRLRSLGVFPESRLVEKRLTHATLSMVFDRAAAAGIDVKLFILEGDIAAEGMHHPCTRIPRNFSSLAAAIKSVDCVVSADSLPAHLAEYFDRPTFVALPAANEYWMPFGCFIEKRWSVFGIPPELGNSLDEFFATSAAGHADGIAPFSGVKAGNAPENRVGDTARAML